MTFDKPKNVTFTDMAIYIDNHIYNKECDDTLIYIYLYHLSYMLALKNKYFKKISYYDDFAIFNANRIYFRLKNKNQFKLDSNGNYKLNKVKSVLNYLKSTIYFNKIQFEQQEYSQNLTNVSHENIDVCSGYTFYDYLYEYASDLRKVEFKSCLYSISKTVRNYLKNIPYKYKSLEWYNIYISVLLSLTNSFTNISQSTIYDKYINKDYIILYNVDIHLKEYIYILVNTLKHIVAKDLSLILNENVYIPSYTKEQLIKELNSDDIRDVYNK